MDKMNDSKLLDLGLDTKPLSNDIDKSEVKKLPKWRILFLFLQIITGKIHLSKYVNIIKTKEMRIETTNSLVHLDGEPITLSKTITLKNHPKSLKIFATNEKK